MGNPRCADGDRLPCYLLLDVHEIVMRCEGKLDEIRADLVEAGVKLTYLRDTYHCDADGTENSGGDI